MNCVNESKPSKTLSITFQRHILDSVKMTLIEITYLC